MVDEKILLEKAQAGDREALSELLVFHEAACYSLALHLTGNATDAEDICQDALSYATSHVYHARLKTQLLAIRRNHKGARSYTMRG